MRILFIGDVIGKPGRRAVRLLLPGLRERYRPDVVVANGENLAGGAGITRDTGKEMLGMGIAGLTTGNHVFDQREALTYLEEDVPIVRPLNYPPGTPGRGWMDLPVGDKRLTVVSLHGRTYMRPLDDPFRAIDTLLSELEGRTNILVDVHAEATGEKGALAFYLDGRVSAIVGTHTHVPTADARILPCGTAFITDVGMVGPRDSIIRLEPEAVIQRQKTLLYHRFEVARGPVAFNAVVIDLDASGRAIDIKLVQDLLEK